MGLSVVVIAAVAVPPAIPLYRQYVAIRDIERLDGWIGAREGGPKWLRDRIGDEPMKAFDRVQAVRLGGAKVDNDVLARMAALGGLKWLSLDKTGVTDEGLAHLRALQHLETLKLDQTRITDAGLVHLAGLRRLRFLYLAQTQVTDAGIAALKRALPDLQVETSPDRPHHTSPEGQKNQPQPDTDKHPTTKDAETRPSEPQPATKEGQKDLGQKNHPATAAEAKLCSRLFDPKNV